MTEQELDKEAKESWWNSSVSGGSTPIKIYTEAYKSGYKKGCKENYWTSVKNGTPKGWCNVLLCEYYKRPCIDKPFRKQYTQISFGIGIFTEGKWVVKDVDLEYCDVIAYHEIENDNLDLLVDRMQREQ